MSSQKNIWMLDKWYAQSVAGNAGYTGERTLWAWGVNQLGELGQNNPQTNRRSSPVQIGTATNWRQLAYAGSQSEWISCLRTDYEASSGTNYGWGKNDQGQLGLSNTVNRSSPTQTYQGSEWKWNQLAKGWGMQMGVLTNGKLYVWGYNSYGNLGLNQPSPTTKDDPDSGSNLGMGWATGDNTIASGSNTCYAIKDNGTLWSWGRSNAGQLGDNGTTDRSSPVQIPGTWSKVFAGESAAAAINPSGEMFTWGDNGTWGVLGHNNKTDYSSPKQLPGTTWKAASFTVSRSAFLKTTGELYMCGHGGQGQLGQNNTNEYSSPRQIPGTTWNKIMNGYANHMGAIKTDGTLWTWGSNNQGQLGHNQGEPGGQRSSPTQVPGTYIDVMGTDSVTFAIRES